MKKLLMLTSLLAVIFAGDSTFAQENRDREAREREVMAREEAREREMMEHPRGMMPMPGRRGGGHHGMRGMMPPPPETIGCGCERSKCGKSVSCGCGGSKCGNIRKCPVAGNPKIAAAFCHLMVIIMLIVHILVTIWVYKDIQERKSGSGIWVVLALLTGLWGTAVYALVRIGDGKK